jgi:hypothetical protein
MVRANIIEGIETVLTLYHNLLKHGIEVQRSYTDVPPILCYPDEDDDVSQELASRKNHALWEQLVSNIIWEITLSMWAKSLAIPLPWTRHRGGGLPALNFSSAWHRNITVS